MSSRHTHKMIAERHNTIARRAGLFLDEIFSGPHKDKRVAQHLGISSNMASLLRRGQSWTIDRLEQVRHIHGWDFVRYVFEAPEPDFAVLRAELRKALEQLPKAKSTSTYLWFEDRGECWDAPAGHAEFVRRRTGLPIHAKGDLRAHYCRNKGWIALEINAAAQVTIWHHAIAIDRAAARGCCSWLVRHAHNVRNVRRFVEIDGNIAEIDGETPASAADAIEAASNPTHPSHHPTLVRRLPLDQVSEHFHSVLNAYFEEPANALKAAVDLGLMATASVLTANEHLTSVRSDFMGPAVVLPRDDIVGRSVMARGEPEYAGMIFAQAIASLREPTFYHNRIHAYGIPMNYQRLALPIGSRQVLCLPHSFRKKAA
jgi:hypothetical protein